MIEMIQIENKTQISYQIGNLKSEIRNVENNSRDIIEFGNRNKMFKITFE